MSIEACSCAVSIYIATYTDKLSLRQSIEALIHSAVMNTESAEVASTLMNKASLPSKHENLVCRHCQEIYYLCKNIEEVTALIEKSDTDSDQITQLKQLLATLNSKYKKRQGELFLQLLPQKNPDNNTYTYSLSLLHANEKEMASYKNILHQKNYKEDILLLTLAAAIKRENTFSINEHQNMPMMRRKELSSTELIDQELSPEEILTLYFILSGFLGYQLSCYEPQDSSIIDITQFLNQPHLQSANQLLHAMQAIIDSYHTDRPMHAVTPMDILNQTTYVTPNFSLFSSELQQDEAEVYELKSHASKINGDSPSLIPIDFLEAENCLLSPKSPKKTDLQVNHSKELKESELMCSEAFSQCMLTCTPWVHDSIKLSHYPNLEKNTAENASEEKATEEGNNLTSPKSIEAHNNTSHPKHISRNFKDVEEKKLIDNIDAMSDIRQPNLLPTHTLIPRIQQCQLEDQDLSFLIYRKITGIFIKSVLTQIAPLIANSKCEATLYLPCIVPKPFEICEISDQSYTERYRQTQLILVSIEKDQIVEWSELMRNLKFSGKCRHATRQELLIKTITTFFTPQLSFEAPNIKEQFAQAACTLKINTKRQWHYWYGIKIAAAIINNANRETNHLLEVSCEDNEGKTTELLSYSQLSNFAKQITSDAFINAIDDNYSIRYGASISNRRPVHLMQEIDSLINRWSIDPIEAPINKSVVIPYQYLKKRASDQKEAPKTKKKHI